MSTSPVRGWGGGMLTQMKESEGGCCYVRRQQDVEVVGWREGCECVCVCVSSSGECDRRDQRQMKRSLLPWGQSTYESATDSEARGQRSQI